MAATGFAYSHLFARDLPAPAPRWTGFPKYNFIGGHNDPDHVPAAELAAAAEAVLRRDGADLALYNPHGPQGFRGIREFVVSKVKDGQGGFGFNAQTLEYGDLIKAGVIDPTKVVRTALQNAGSISSLMLTTEAIVAEIPEKKEAPMPGGGHGGGMGDMY